MGLDPSAWKDLAAGISDPLRLDAGLQIDFSASVSVGTGLGVTAGASAGVSDAAAAGPDPANPAAVTAAGGLSQALSQQTATTSAAAAAASRAAFPGPVGAPVGATATASGPATVAAPVAAAQGVAPVPTVTVDPRAASYGYGIPLRPLVAVPDRSAVALVHDRVRGGWAPAGQLRRPSRFVGRLGVIRYVGIVWVWLRWGRSRRSASGSGAGEQADAGHRGRGLLHRRGRLGRRRGRWPARRVEPLEPTWAEQQRHRLVARLAACDRSRTEGGGFDA